VDHFDDKTLPPTSDAEVKATTKTPTGAVNNDSDDSSVSQAPNTVNNHENKNDMRRQLTFTGILKRLKKEQQEKMEAARLAIQNISDKASSKNALASSLSPKAPHITQELLDKMDETAKNYMLKRGLNKGKAPFFFSIFWRSSVTKMIMIMKPRRS
jgi:hypothetical protein